MLWSVTTFGFGAMPLRSIRFPLSLSLSLSTSTILLECWLRIVLSASGPVAEDAVVAVSDVVMLSVVEVAVLWHVVVAVVPSTRSVLLSPFVGGCCPVRSCCLGAGPCAFLESGFQHQVSSSFLAFPSQQVMPLELVLLHI